MTNGNGKGSRTERDPEIVRAEAEIARTREAVGQSMEALQHELSRLSRSFDWREWIRRRPMLAVGIAFGVGALLGCWRSDFYRKTR